MAFERSSLGIAIFLSCLEGQYCFDEHPQGMEPLMRRSDVSQGENVDQNDKALSSSRPDPMDFVSVDAMNKLMLSQQAFSSRPRTKTSMQSQLSTHYLMEKDVTPAQKVAALHLGASFPFQSVVESGEQRKMMNATETHENATTNDTENTTTNHTANVTIAENETNATTVNSTNVTTVNSTNGTNSTNLSGYKTEDQETYCDSTCHGCQYINGPDGVWACDSADLGNTPEQCEEKEVVQIQGVDMIKLWCDPNLPSFQITNIDNEMAATSGTTTTTKLFSNFTFRFVAVTTTTTTSWWEAQHIEITNANDPMCNGEFEMYDTFNSAPRYRRKDQAMWIVLCGSSMAGPKCVHCGKHHGVFTWVISQYPMGKRHFNDFDEHCELQSHCFAFRTAKLNHPYIFMMYAGLIEWYSVPAKAAEAAAHSASGHSSAALSQFRQFKSQYGRNGRTDPDEEWEEFQKFLLSRQKKAAAAVRDHNLTISIVGDEYKLMGYKVLPFFRFLVGCDSEQLFEHQNDKRTCIPQSMAPFPVKRDFKPDQKFYTVFEAARQCELDSKKCIGFDCEYLGPNTRCRIHSCNKDNAPCYGCHEWEKQITYNPKCVSANSTTAIPHDCVSDVQGCLSKLGCLEDVTTCKSDGMEVADDWQHMAFYKLDLLCRENGDCPYKGMIADNANHTWLTEEDLHHKKRQFAAHSTSHTSNSTSTLNTSNSSNEPANNHRRRRRKKQTSL